jgi:coenzyme F420-0:L-glutamate ligase/coenzyme F420-1:gamma-L-glutamate ligase
VQLEDGDVVVVAQKAFSKAERRVVRIEDVEASDRAHELAGARDPREVEIVLRETARIVRARDGSRSGVPCVRRRLARGAQVGSTSQR